MRPKLLGGALLLVSFVTSTPAPGAAFIIGGPPESLAQTYWAWDTSRTQPFRDALTNPANFGPGGTVTTAIGVQYISDYSNLSGVNAVIAPWWPDSNLTPVAQAQIVNYFVNGGSLMLFQDDNYHDPVGDALGLPVWGSATDTWAISGAIGSGPFGTATPIFTSGNYSFFDSTAIQNLNGTVVGVDGSGQPTVATWAKGKYCATCGALLLVGDIDTVVDAADFGGMNTNARFGLNAVAWLVANSGEPSTATVEVDLPTSVPEPSTAVLGGLALAALAFRKRYLRG